MHENMEICRGAESAKVSLEGTNRGHEMVGLDREACLCFSWLGGLGSIVSFT